jgi:CheY-like chemotaxis protein
MLGGKDPASGVGPASSPSLVTSRPGHGTSTSSIASERSQPSERSLLSPTGGLRSQIRSQPLASSVAIEEPTSSGTTSATIGGGKQPGRHVLIIDDSPVILDNARRALEADGYRVTTTTQTVGAARHLVSCDLALIDFHMPGFNGADVIKSLRAASAASGRTCLFYLYTSDSEVAKNYARDGFDGSLTGKGDDAALLRGVRAAFRVLQMRAMKKV